jgi:hypothetical protein
LVGYQRAATFIPKTHFLFLLLLQRLLHPIMADTEEKKIVTEEQVITRGDLAFDVMDPQHCFSSMAITTWVLDTNSADISIHRRKLKPLPMSTLSLLSSFPKSKSRLWKKTRISSSRCRSFLPCFKTPGVCALGCYACDATVLANHHFFYFTHGRLPPPSHFMALIFINLGLFLSVGELSSSATTKA